MDLNIDDYKELLKNIRLIKTNLIQGIKAKPELDDLNTRLDILCDFLSTYYNLETEERTPQRKRLIRKIKSDIEYYSLFIWKEHRKILNELRYFLVEGYNKTNITRDFVTKKSKVLIKGVNNPNEFFIEFTDSRNEEEIQGNQLIFIVYVGKPIAKKIIGKTVGHKFNFGKFEYEVIEIFDKQSSANPKRIIKFEYPPELRIIGDALESLKEKEIIRTDNFVGDLGEYYCQEELGITLCKNVVNEGFDGYDNEDGRVQIKTLRTPKNAGKIPFTGLNFDYLIFVELNKFFEVENIYKINVDLLKENIEKKYIRLSVGKLKGIATQIYPCFD